MSEPDPTTPDEQVRRLLADARADEPMPDDVAGRLDGVLADLQGESRRTPAPVDLAARRRRGVARNVLVAAAAVVVVGVGITQVDLAGQSDDGASSSDAGGATAPESAAREEADSDAESNLNRLVRGRPLVLSSEDFERRARQLSLHPPLESLADLPLVEGYSGDLSSDNAAAARAWCTNPAWGAGELVRVRYDGERGVLVLRDPVDGTRDVDLYLCGETFPTRSTAVPAG